MRSNLPDAINKTYRDALGAYSKNSIEEAIKLFHSILNDLNKLDLRKYAIASKMLLICYSKLGNFKAALKWGEEALKIFQKLNLEEDIAKTYYNISISLCKIGKFNEALENIKKVKTVRYFKSYTPLLLQSEGIALKHLNRYKESIEKLNQALSEVKDKDRTFYIKEILSDLYFLEGFHNEALKLVNEVISYWDEIKKDKRAKSYYQRAKIYEEMGSLTSAFNDINEAISILEGKIFEIRNDDFRKSFLEQNYEIYIKSIELGLKLKRYEDVFKYIQKIKARVLSDLLFTKEFFPKEIFGELYSLRDEVEKYFNSIDELNKKEVDRIKKLEEEYFERLQILKEKNYEFFEIIKPNILELKEVSDMLNDETACLDIFVFNDNIIFYLITSCGYDVEILKYDYNLLECFTDNLHRLIKMGEKAIDYLNFYTKDFYNKVLNKIFKKVKGIKKLLIIPHQIFHKLPFSILKTCDDEYLIEKFELSFLPSILSLKHYKEGIKNLKLKSCFIIADSLGDLKYSKKEAQIVSKCFDKYEILSDKDATVEKFKEKYKEFDVLHFACHCEFKIDNPVFSHIMLRDNKGEKYRFNISDIMALDLKNTKLVVLSACESGEGEIHITDEITCISRAFMIAGVNSLIVTLWEVDDEVSSKLMEEMYRNLIKGESVSSSLRLAQLKIKNEYPSPYFWAGFEYIGM